MKRFFGAVQDSFNKENVKLDTIEDRDEAIYVGRNGEVFAYAPTFNQLPHRVG